jgi:hypothetical protein
MARLYDPTAVSRLQIALLPRGRGGFRCIAQTRLLRLAGLALKSICLRR